MSVIVKGMEMPGDCWECPFCAIVDGPYCEASRKPVKAPGKPKPECPLRPLPEKHGRLIEADSLKETLDYYIREAGWGEKTNRVLGWVKDEFIDAETTIVEAEGEEEGSRE